MKGPPKDRVHLEVTVGVSRRKATLSISRSTGVVELRFYRERRSYVGHVSELAEGLYTMRCRELVREAALQKRRRSA